MNDQTRTSPPGQFGAAVEASRKCLSCDYSLVGLKIGDRCPECGTPISGRIAFVPPDSIFQMPGTFLLTIHRGGIMLMWATAPAIFSAIASLAAIRFEFSPTIPVILAAFSSACWAAAAWLLLTPRPREASAPRDPVSEWFACRWFARLSQAGWPLAFTLFAIAPLLSSAPTANAFILFGVILCLGAFVGLWPLCIYFARLCDWAEDDVLARRLRLLPWVLILCTIASIAVSFILPHMGGGPISFGLMPLGGMFVIGMLVTLVLALVCFTRLGNTMRWVLLNREESFASSVRRNETLVKRVNTVTPREDPAKPRPSKEPPPPERIWTGPAHRKPQGNYLAPSDASDEILLAPANPSANPPDNQTPKP